MKNLFFISLLAAVISCNDEPVIFVEVNPSSPTLEIINHTERPVFFYAIELESSDKVRLGDPCIDFQPNLPADTTIHFLYEDIMGFNEDAKEVWFWWTDCVNNSDMETYPLYPN